MPATPAPHAHPFVTTPGMAAAPRRAIFLRNRICGRTSCRWDPSRRGCWGCLALALGVLVGAPFVVLLVGPLIAAAGPG